MALAGRLLAQMDVHHAGPGVERRLCFARHLLRGDRYMMLFRIGQHAVQRAGDDSLVAHGAALIVWVSADRRWDHGACAVKLLASSRYRQVRSGPRLAKASAVKHAGIAAVDRQIPRARKDRARLQSVEPADRVAEMRRIGIANILRQMRKINVLVDKMQQMPRPLPGAIVAE